jgi:glucans biosynthesis protein
VSKKAPIVVICFLLNLGLSLAQPVKKHLSFDDIAGMARERAAKPFVSEPGQLPEELRPDKLDYDKYREIHFRHEKALWLKDELPFRLEFFHPGYLYQTPVSLNEFSSTHVQPIRFVQDFFDYGKTTLPKKVPADTGYAGFKLLYQLNNPNRWDELAAFLGASYFRCLGKDQSYGQSARGLAINSGEPDRPEEFPAFTTWWIGKPEKESKTLHLYALLESASCEGAYDFLIRPGETTFVEIDAVLYFRPPGSTNSLKTVGFAPLTSMFWFGENSQMKFDDYRPEVHDSDGLLIRFENDSFTWIPLKNPKQLEHRIFQANNPKGFGLLQRDRQFADYQDLFNSYHRVPSVWVEPRGNWGEGSIHLVQLPAKHEGVDNIAAFWDPAVKPEPMQAYHVGYILHWATEPDEKFPAWRVVQTRSGVDQQDSAKRQFVIDFRPPNETPASDEALEARVKCAEDCAVSDIQVFRNEVSKAWRVFFSLKPDAANKQSVDIQCWLVKGNSPLSETWNYLWNRSPQK